MRLFIAIDLPDPLRDTLAALCFPSQTVHWSPPGQYHLTLAFLGDQPDNLLEPICEALETVEFTAFTLQTLNPGCYRHGALWLGIEPHDALQRLYKRVNRALQSAGVKYQQRRFQPHITLGRCRTNPAAATELLHHRLGQHRYRFEVDRFLLKSSVLRQDGAVHHTEAEFLAD